MQKYPVKWFDCFCKCYAGHESYVVIVLGLKKNITDLGQNSDTNDSFVF